MSRAVIVDTSIAIKWVVIEEPLHREARALLGQRVAFLAPEVLVAEAGNVLLVKLRNREIQRTQLAAALHFIPACFDGLVPARDLARRAAEIGSDPGFPSALTFVDALYLALAERERTQLVTDDRRLLGRVMGTPWAARVVALELV